MTDLERAAQAAKEAAEQQARWRADLGTRCEYQSNRVRSSDAARDVVCAGAANVLAVLGWGLKRNDLLGGVALRLLDENAKLLYGGLNEIGKAVKAQQEGNGGIVAPSAEALAAIQRSRQR